MKKSRLRKLAVTACALCMTVPLACAPLTACGKKPTNPPGEEEVAIVTSLTLNTASVKTSFAYGEAFSYTGLTITANFSDGTSEPLPVTMCTVSTPDMKVPGVKTITVTYKNIKATYQITVAERQMPPISKTPLAEINSDDVYRIEAEAIDYEISGVKAVEDKNLIIDLNAQPEEPATQADEEQEVSGGKYLANYGVEGNYFGFTFTADKEYKNATLVFRAANPTTTQLGMGTNMNMYLNYKSSKEMGQLDIADINAFPAAKKVEGEDGLVMEWATRIIRGVTIPAGTNTLTFDVLGEDVVCLDYIEIYAGVAYGTNSVTEINEVGTVIKDVEDFDLEKIVVRADIKQAHGLPDGVAFTEAPSVNGANTHGGRCVAAMAAGSEITTALRLEDKATIHILYTIASCDGYKVKDNYEFYIDGELLENVEDYYIKAGDPWRQGSQFWEWRDTSLGYVDLEAGDHIFTVKVTGKDCNCDCFKFDVLSYGEFTEHPEQSGKITVDGLGTYVIEGENIDMFYEEGHSYIVSGEGVTDGYYKIGAAADCSNGRYINSFNAGSKFVFTIYSIEDVTFDIAMRAVRPDVEDGASVADSLKLFLDETEIPVSETAEALDVAEWKTITLAEGVQLEGGKVYTFTMEITDPFWLDNISFVTSEYNGELPSLGSIKLDTSSVKKHFNKGDAFTFEGLAVMGVMTNDVTFPIELDECTVSTPDMATAGEKTVTVTYNGKTATYKIIVHGDIEGISLNTDRAKKDFDFGDAFTANGIIVMADTGNGTYLEIDLSECTVVEEPDMLKVGEQTVKISYQGFEATYKITVKGVAPHTTLNSTSGNVTVEAENIDRRGVIQDAGNPTENWSANGQSGVSLRGVQKGSKLNIYVEAEEDITVKFIAVLSKYEALDVKDMLAVSVDGNAITTPSLVLGRTDGNDWFNWKDADFGEIELTAGLHVITIEVIGAGPNMDCFRFEVAGNQTEGGEEGGETGGESGENTPETEAVLNEEQD